MCSLISVDANKSKEQSCLGQVCKDGLVCSLLDQALLGSIIESISNLKCSLQGCIFLTETGTMSPVKATFRE